MRNPLTLRTAAFILALVVPAAVFADTIYVRDTFTDSNGVALGSHLADIHPASVGWGPILGSGSVTISNGKAVVSGWGYEARVLNTGLSDLNIAVDVTSTDATPFGGLIFRALDNDRYFMLRYDGPYLFRHQNGDLQNLGNGNVHMSPGVTYRLEVRLRGSQIQVYSNGVLQFTVNDSSYQTATNHGLIWYPAEDPTMQFDNLELTLPNSAPVISGPSNRTDLEGTSASVQISASDPEGAPLTYGATGLPPGLSVNTTTGLISGTISIGSFGFYSTVVSASDGVYTSTRNLTWVVVNASARVYDTFTGSNGTSLGSHTPDVAPGGVSWQHLRGSGSATLSNGTAGATGPVYEVWTTDPGISDVTVAVDFTSTDATPYGGLVFRATDATNYFMLRYNGPYLYRVVNGDIQYLGSGNVSMTSGQTYRLEVRTHGSQISVLSGGVLLFTVNDTFQQTATKHGLMWYPLEDSTARMDNFELSAYNGVPLISGPVNQLHRAGTAVSVQVAASDPDGNALTYGATGLPAGLSINPATGLISGTLSSTITGTYSVTTTAWDGTTTATRAFSWTVMPVSTLVYDTFAGADGTILYNHSPDINVQGSWWRLHRGTGSAKLNNGRVSYYDGSAGLEVWAIDPGQSDVDVSVSFTSGATNPYGGIVFRATDSDNFLFLRYDGPYLYRFQNGDFNSIATGHVSMQQGQTYHLEVHARGSQIEVYSDGILQFTATETFQQTATRHGLAWMPVVDSTPQMDDFVISAPAGVPLILGPGDQTSTEGGSASVPIVAIDQGGGSLTYGASGLPPGLSLNTATGVISGTLAPGSSYTFPVTLTASNGVATSTRVITWAVLEPDTVTRIYDDFTGQNGTLLSEHTPEVSVTGLKWRWLHGLYIPTFYDGRVKSQGSPKSEAWTLDVGLADVTLSALVVSEDPTPYGGIVLRASDASHYLFLRYEGMNLYKRIGDDFYPIATGSNSFNIHQWHVLKVRAVGNEVSVYADGLLQYTVTETFNQTATRHGLFWDPVEDATFKVDTFQIRSNQAITSVPQYECQTTVTPLQKTVGSGNGTYSVSVWIEPGCDGLNYSTESDFIPEISVHDTGFNTADVTFSIQNNTQTTPRIGHIIVADHTVEIIQAGIPGPSCISSIEPRNSVVSSRAATRTITVSASQECNWTVINTGAFVHVLSQTSTSGSGTIEFSVDSNLSGVSREAELMIGSLSASVTQDARYIGVTLGWADYLKEQDGNVCQQNPHLIQKPLFAPYNRDTDQWWSNTIEEAAFANVSYVALNFRGDSACGQPLLYGELGGEPTEIARKAVTAIENRQLRGSLHIALFDDTYSYIAERASCEGLDSFDLSDQSLWEKYIWQAKWFQFFDKIPNDNLMKIDGRPLIFMWSIEVPWRGNEFLNRNKGSALIDWLRGKVSEKTGLDPFIVVDESWLRWNPNINDHVDGIDSWFNAETRGGPTNSRFPRTGQDMTFRNNSHFVTGVANPGYWSVDQSTDRRGGQTLRDGLSATTDANLVLLEGLTDIEENAGLYRGDTQALSCSAEPPADRWSTPNQYLNIIREFTIPEPQYVVFEAEASDALSADGPGSGLFRRTNDFDIAYTDGSHSQWSVAASEGGWFEFSNFKTARSASWLLRVRYSSTNGATARLLIDGTAVTDINLPATGSESAYQFADVSGLSWSADRHDIRLAMVSGRARIDHWLIDALGLIQPQPAVGKWANFAADDGLYMVAEMGGGDIVNADRPIVGPWESFVLVDVNGGQLQSGDHVYLKTENGRYLTVQGGGGSSVAATATVPGPWETFTIELAEGSGTAITDQSKVTLRTVASPPLNQSYYLTAESGGGGPVVANRVSPGIWETFTISIR